MTWAAVTSLKPGQACFPRMDCHGADGAGEDVPANEPCRMALMSLFPSAATHNLQIQVGPPALKLRLLHPKDVEPLGWKSFEKPRGLHVSWWWGSHLQPPSLGLPHLRMKAPLCRVALPELGFDQGIKGKEGFPGGSDGRESACNAGDSGSMPESGRSLSEGNGYPLQYSCLENSMDRGAQQATVHGVAKSWK